MNQAESNDRAIRFSQLTKRLPQLGNRSASPDRDQFQIVVTAGVMRLLEPANNGYYPNLRSSNPKDRWSLVQFFQEEGILRANGLGARGAGSKVSQIIGLGYESNGAVQEGIEAMIISLQYPLLNPDQVSRKHRELLQEYGYFNSNDTCNGHHI